MRLLCVDTCGASASVALADGSRLLGEATQALDRRLSSRLLALIDGLLNEAGMTAADLDGFAVTRGPGSFTGVRIGMATVKGLALAVGKPVVGVSSLALLAAGLPFACHQVCTLLDARKNEVYAGLFRCGALPVPLGPEVVVTPESLLASVVGPTIFVGDGSIAYEGLIRKQCGDFATFAPSFCSLPRAACGIELARDLFLGGDQLTPGQLAPSYIRPSEAEVAKAAKG